jgi:hypothetical protein
LLFIDLNPRFQRDQQKLAANPPTSPPPLLELPEDKKLVYHHLRIRVIREQEEYRKCLYLEAMLTKDRYYTFLPDVSKQIQVLLL